MHKRNTKFSLRISCNSKQGSFFWHQNKEGEPLVGVFATNHQPEVLPIYFGARKKNPDYKYKNRRAESKNRDLGF
jgi:hypothetical protein